jgi:two-component system sensor histidine kinase DesK
METTGAERALARMRRYTTWSLVLMTAFFVVLSATGTTSVWYRVLLLVVGAAATYYISWWERMPPLWLTLPLVVAASALWTVSLFLLQSPISALVLFIIAMVPISQLRRHRAALALLSVVLALVPVGIAWAVWPEKVWAVPAATAIACAGAAAFLLFLNRYAWGLYLEIDSARQLAADLAVAQERYRFASDLHDIQGHTLHVLRLTTKLAAKLIDTDPDAARAQLAEADALIAETLANTRSLAFGDRKVTLAGELANAESLFEAAGIACRTTGTPAAGPHEELFGLVVREATTNILRHAQPTTVEIAIDPKRLKVTNDGSPATSRAPSGLARLAERFAAVGGSLRTSTRDGVFTTEATTA